jgi:hypothetical protein
MKILLRIMITSIALMLASCATGVLYETYTATLGPIPADHGRIFVYRLEGEADSVSSAVRFNGEPIGRAVPGTFFYRDLPIGPYLLAAAKNTDRTLTVHVSEGSTQYIRVDIMLRSMRWDLDLTLVPEEKAVVELAQTTKKE